ncbi:hypothetical protein GQF42_31090 [Streptomyces broussonetiae]|uniref:Uncharacterized protein n=1 Tax=Streptomyces broussonetiae TaxID=2686304 RepID=A0A6I6NGQ3_9ACTN|nr:hypothetical protein GQF42_31090 [Streptomyces broussonetiae]
MDTEGVVSATEDGLLPTYLHPRADAPALPIHHPHGIPVGITSSVGHHLKITTGGERVTALHLAGAAPFENSGKGDGQRPPELDSHGNPIKYTEWGTARSIDNPSRGGERIATGSDGSAYCTPTHHQRYIVMETGR